MQNLNLLIMLICFFSFAQAKGPALRLEDLPSLDNMATFVRTQNPDETSSRYKNSRSTVEKNIYASLLDNPSDFTSDLSAIAIDFTLKSPEGLITMRRLDSLMTSATQDLAERAAHDLKLKSSQAKTAANEKIAKIRVIEKKRDEIAQIVSTKLTEGNFNQIFDFLVQSHFRRAEGLNHSLILPKEIKILLFGRNNPNQSAFKALKKMTVDVLSAEDKGPLQKVRQLKISGTAELIPALKPTLHAWEVEAYYFRRSSNRAPSAAPKATEPKSNRP